MAPKLRIGDVIEVATNKGLAYAQYSHDHARCGSLLRVLPGVVGERPSDICALTSGAERFFVFYPLAAAVRLRLATVVAQCPLPDHARPFPLLRHWGGRDPVTRVMRWWLWDSSGVEVSRVDELTPEQMQRSIAQISNHASLVEMIETDWTPERATAQMEAGSRPTSDEAGIAANGKRTDTDQRLLHYLYFPDRPSAERAAAQLRADGSEVEARPSADGSNWLVLASGVSGGASDEVRAKMEALAGELHGEYDGWELEV